MWSAFDDFIAWAEEKTGQQMMRQVTLAAFAASTFRTEIRSGDVESLTVSILSAKAMPSEIILRDPDLQGLGDLASAAEERGDASADLALIDLSGTRLVDYQPPARPGRLSVVIKDSGSGKASVDLHFCEDDLPFVAAARFLDKFAAHAAEPILQLL